ncbi:cell division ATP-binding protein FtsE [Plebeiibacterium marinum]|uniref:Cell division ATP-binding protein FtsE n=1 Tax=Plebeiibacterium marinum TaxID=2992111 RepID=A0AAE3SL74_9BACT|nr:ATP-binding cassette domain-containing protein [Plebeiobacterium marinum]MCW3807605.1 ATP-binding cassette domain-containing protein [Plebeiobacterium marinum]
MSRKKNTSIENDKGNIVELKNAVIRHRENIVLKDVNLEVKKGEFIYLIGKVGSGKSSLLKSIYAEIEVSDGDIFAVGYDLKKMKTKHIPYLRRKMGIIFQDFQLLSDRTVYDNLSFVLKATGWKNKKEIDTRIREVLTQVDMVHKGYKKPHQLSGGEQQRIGIARALLNEPDLILADEPTGNLDPETTNELMVLLQKISEMGKTVIMATHNYGMIDKYKGRILKCEDTRLKENQ